MRKNSPRKWLHAILDLLPVILIPVFMIYSHRHEINTGSIQVVQNKLIDFNQQLNDERLTVLSPYSTYTYDSSTNTYSVTATQIGGVWQIGLRKTNDFGFVQGHYYALIFESSDNLTYYCGLNGDEFQYVLYDSHYVLRLQYDSRIGTNGIFGPRNYSGVYHISNPMAIDLTQAFGVGNEPVQSDILNYFPNDYYDFTLSRDMVIPNYTITYDDTDIMSQFTYQLYNSVDKYFNMGNVFNMNGVYDWFNLNIFNGNAPIYIFIVWQIVLYEFVMDLLFLLYGLFMWFIDMVQHLMDKPFKSIK